MEIDDDIDVRALLPAVRVPTLVVHCDGDRAVLPERGRALAAAIPGARYVSLPSANHLVLEEEPAWQLLLEAASWDRTMSPARRTPNRNFLDDCRRCGPHRLHIVSLRNVGNPGEFGLNRRETSCTVPVHGRGLSRPVSRDVPLQHEDWALLPGRVDL